jgi:hypothetical protein
MNIFFNEKKTNITNLLKEKWEKIRRKKLRRMFLSRYEK